MQSHAMSKSRLSDWLTSSVSQSRAWTRMLGGREGFFGRGCGDFVRGGGGFFLGGVRVWRFVVMFWRRSLRT